MSIELKKMYRKKVLLEKYYRSPEKDLFSSENVALIFLFGELILFGIGENKRLYLSRSWSGSCKLFSKIPVVIPVIRYENIFDYTRKKNLNYIQIQICEDTKCFTRGSFGLEKLFCKEEPVIEFLFLEDLKLKTSIPKSFICSESLFEYLFDKI